ncbi:major capsid protein [Caldimonas taiwanensis]|uniref:major capsid protein n=1 Tax=Caldimonas taiwanensis TaxID=307483 RepID=UPI000780D2D6|nr:major capsid protein [Caldimonas taiwanensis]
MLINDFTNAELTAAINAFPVQWGRIGQMNLFPTRGVPSRSVIIEEASGTLAVLPSHEWGGEGTTASKINRRTVAFAIKQTVHEDTILPGDIQDVRGFGIEGLNTVASEVARRLQRMRAKHDITLEWKRMGALKGQVTNGDGSVIADLFQAFGVTQVSVNFELGNASTSVLSKCAQVINQIEDNLKGDTMTGVTALVSPEFYSALVEHPKVQDAYKFHSEAAARLGQDMRAGFPFGGITFVEYRATVSGNRLIAANQGHAFPVGTVDTFATYFAPADFNETVNTVGLPFYMKQWEREGGRGIVLHSQCNSLPLCHQPAVLVRLTNT